MAMVLQINGENILLPKDNTIRVVGGHFSFDYLMQYWSILQVRHTRAGSRFQDGEKLLPAGAWRLEHSLTMTRHGDETEAAESCP